MIRSLALATVLLGQASTAALAQDNFAATLAPVEEELGQSVGGAAFTGPNIFVTATGRARLPAPVADTYYVAVQGKNASAVVAARERDAKVAELQVVARRLGVDLQVGETSIGLEVDTDAQQRLAAERTAHRQLVQSTQPPPLSLFIPPPDATPKIFVAKTSLRFRTASNDTLPAFFDAIHAAGVDDISHGLPQHTNMFLPQASNFMGFGSTATLDDSFWAAASQEAFRSARTQAQALAAASGRTLGPARQITVLSRTTEGAEAVESLGVRFGLADSAH
jgi:uncharacterized protein YggE